MLLDGGTPTIESDLYEVNHRSPVKYRTFLSGDVAIVGVENSDIVIDSNLIYQHKDIVNHILWYAHDVTNRILIMKNEVHQDKNETGYTTIRLPLLVN